MHSRSMLAMGLVVLALLLGAPAAAAAGAQINPPAAGPASATGGSPQLAEALLELGRSFPAPALQQLGWRPTSASTPCTWGGISCNSNGQIVSLNVSGLGLSGSLNKTLSSIQNNSDVFASLEILETTSNFQTPSMLPPDIGLLLPNVTWLGCTSNLLTGSLPSWGGQVPGLQTLLLDNNTLTGTLPISWAERGGMPSLQTLGLANNSFKGSVPPQWGNSSQNAGSGMPKLASIAISLSQGNASQLCGPLPLNAASDTVPQGGNANGTFTPFHGSLLASCGDPDWSAALLEVADSFAAFPYGAGTQRWTGWSNASVGEPCAWAGVTCQNASFALNLSTSGLTGTLNAASWAGVNSNLTDVDFSGNPGFGGVLPPGLSVSKLTSLRMQNCNVSGIIPVEYIAPGSFPNLKLLDQSNNPLLIGSLNNWNTSAAMPNLQSLNASNCPLLLEGLPTQLGFNMLELDLSMTGVTGTLPVAFANSSLMLLQLGGTSVNGTLPAAWGQGFPDLTVLNLSHTALTGTIPAWGAATAGTKGMQNLQALYLQGANLSGSLPNLFSSLPNLATLVLQPGNEGVCGSIPGNHTILNGTGQPITHLPACPGSPNTTSTSASPSPASGTSIGAIVGGVVGGIVAVLVAAAGLTYWYLHHRRQTKPQAGSTGTGTSSTILRQMSLLNWEQTRGSASSSDWAERLSSFQGRDWSIMPKRITICHRADGREWRLGSGSFGTVYKARLDATLDVAVKRLNTSLDVDDAQLSRFAKEVAFMHACRHPNCVQFLGACLMEHNVFMVTELMECDLYAALGQESLLDRLAWRRQGHQIAIDIALGLAYLHNTQNVIHFDMKSPNILLSSSFRAKIADTGLHQVMGDQTHLTVGSIRGTWAWLAPEMVHGRLMPA